MGTTMGNVDTAGHNTMGRQNITDWIVIEKLKKIVRLSRRSIKTILFVYLRDFLVCYR